MSAGPPATRIDRARRDATALDAMLQALTSSLEVAEILRIVLQHAKQITTAEGLSLLLYDRERDELVFAATETLQENSLACRETPLPPAVGGLMSPERLIVPVRTEERVLGTIDLRRRYDGRPFDEDDRRRAADVAADLASTVDLERVAHEPEALQAVFARLAAAVASEDAALVVYDRERRELAFRVSRALRQGVIDGVRLHVGKGIAGWVAAHRQAVRLDDARNDPRHDPQIARRTGLVPRSMICVPMVHGDTLHGVIQVINKRDGSAFDDDELGVVQTLADHAAIAIAQVSRQREAQQAALTDHLTGLGNARRFEQVLPALIARGGPLSLLAIGLEGLEAVGERYGQLVRDRTVGGIGHAIGARLRPGDVAVRLEEDELTVILPATDGNTARTIAEELRETIAVSRMPDGTTGITASIGLATFPDDAGEAEQLFRAAHAAMGTVKRSTKNGVAAADASGS